MRCKQTTQTDAHRLYCECFPYYFWMTFSDRKNHARCKRIVSANSHCWVVEQKYRSSSVHLLNITLWLWFSNLCCRCRWYETTVPNAIPTNSHTIVFYENSITCFRFVPLWTSSASSNKKVFIGNEYFPCLARSDNRWMRLRPMFNLHMQCVSTYVRTKITCICWIS